MEKYEFNFSEDYQLKHIKGKSIETKRKKVMKQKKNV